MLLDDYYSKPSVKERRRLAAVQAALEIARASVSATTETDSVEKTANDLRQVAETIGILADAIQAALEKTE